MSPGAGVSQPPAPAKREGVDPMGRGRAKAKQTKVARDLKYRTHETDFGALASELHGQGGKSDPVETPEVDDLDDWTEYSDSRRD